jgi:adhesin transport system membrane fusion protein
MKTKIKEHIFSHILLVSTMVFVIIGLIWANFAILDEVTVGQGKVIPSNQVQVIQNLEGGIVQKVFVHDGEIVQKDQTLIQLDGTRYLASVKEAEKKNSFNAN